MTEFCNSEITSIFDKIPMVNKPYSELWNEEGFTFIDNLKGGRSGLNQKYTLKKYDHPKLFEVVKKAYRKAPTKKQQQELEKNQKGKCNFCGSNVMHKNKLKNNTYAKDISDISHP